jgi:hypothetical protein
MVNRITQRGPSVYETEGPRGLAARTAACAATLRRGATTSARNPPEAPTARLSPRSGISPGWSPFTVAYRQCQRTHPKYRSPGSSSVPEFPPVGPVSNGLPPVPRTRPKCRSPGSSSVPGSPPVGPRLRWPTASARGPTRSTGHPVLPAFRSFPRLVPFPTACRRCRGPAQSAGHPALLAFRGLPRLVPVSNGLPPVPRTRPKCRSPGSSSVPGFPPDGPRFQR